MDPGPGGGSQKGHYLRENSVTGDDARASRRAPAHARRPATIPLQTEGEAGAPVSPAGHIKTVTESKWGDSYPSVPSAGPFQLPTPDTIVEISSLSSARCFTPVLPRTDLVQRYCDITRYIYIFGFSVSAGRGEGFEIQLITNSQ